MKRRPYGGVCNDVNEGCKSVKAKWSGLVRKGVVPLTRNAAVLGRRHPEKKFLKKEKERKKRGVRRGQSPSCREKRITR